MIVISKEEFLENSESFTKKILDGAVFIYPTDTIYGIGCDAANDSAVKRIREIKQRDEKPFSIAVPSRAWIEENCEVNQTAIPYLNKLPGPYTLLLKLKKNSVSKFVTNTGIVGVRIPDNWFAKVIAGLAMPIVSTSANITAQKHMSSMQNLHSDVANKVDFIIYEGEKSGSPSAIIDLTKESPEIIKRG